MLSGYGQDRFNAVSPSYFKTLGIPLKAGRDIDERDRKGATKVIVVNENFTRRYFQRRSPLGYHIGFGGGPQVPQVKLDMEIIGVVADSKYEDLRQEVPRQVLVAYPQMDYASAMTVYVRTALPSEKMFAAIRAEMRNLDASIPLFDLNTMEDQLDRSLVLERMVAYLSSAFGLLATLLAVMGIYGVTAYSVARRAREIGLRAWRCWPWPPWRARCPR
jgi:ABC-type antimicrobial peptide transport system permease subunit